MEPHSRVATRSARAGDDSYTPQIGRSVGHVPRIGYSRACTSAEFPGAIHNKHGCALLISDVPRYHQSYCSTVSGRFRPHFAGLSECESLAAGAVLNFKPGTPRRRGGVLTDFGSIESQNRSICRCRNSISTATLPSISEASTSSTEIRLLGVSIDGSGAAPSAATGLDTSTFRGRVPGKPRMYALVNVTEALRRHLT